MPSITTKPASITPDILARLDPPPKAGEGFNTWLLHAANHLCHAAVSEDNARSYLFEQQWLARGRREDREVNRVLDRAYRPNAIDSASVAGLSEKVSQGQEDPPAPNGHGDLARPNEKTDPALQAAAIAESTTTAGDLLSSSPLEFAAISAGDALRALMGGDRETLVCTGKKTATAKTMPLAMAAESAATRALVVPSPMTALNGINKEGNPSRRCLDNTGPRRFLVIEFDKIESKDDQASLLMFLAKFAPLCAVVDSGGKSLHGWFYCEGQPETDLWRFMRVAVLLGADPAPWSRCQMVRMPEGKRENGAPQTLFYFDEGKIGSEEWNIPGLLEWEAENRSKAPEVLSPLPGGVEAYYNGRQYLLDNGKDYVPMDKNSLRSHLKRGGDPDPEGTICTLQKDRYVKYAGPLAGRDRGLVTFNGNLLLATTNPKVIVSRVGDWPTIKRFLRSLLGSGKLGDAQFKAFMGWLKTARLAMLDRARRPGQALTLVGPVHCGKTLLIKLIILPAMGSRSAHPYRYLSGANNFNHDLLGSEVLVIDDEQSASTPGVRRKFAEGIKSALFAHSLRFEAKGKDAFTFDPLWRIVIAANDSEDSLMLLPQVDGDLSDKLMMLKCSDGVGQLSDTEFERWQARISTELPAFLADVERFEIVPEDRDSRCGVKCFRHPDLENAIDKLSPESQLREMIDLLAQKGAIALPWEGTAAELKSELETSHYTKKSAETLLGRRVEWTGRYLGKLEGKGVTRLPLRDGVQWWRVESTGVEQVE